MKPIKILCDSCSDLTEEMRKEYDIDSIDFTIYIKGAEIPADPWKNITAHDLYNTLRSGDSIYTLPASEFEIEKKLTAYIEQYDIIYVAACQMQSTTIIKAKKIVEELLKKHEGSRIEVIDSLNASVGQGLVTLYAGKLNKEGLPFEEIVKKTKEIRNNVVQYATVETLTYLSRANKINARTAALGNLFGIKPILISDVDGRQTSMGSVRGRYNSVKRIIDLFISNIVDPQKQEIYIIHGDDEATAQYIKEELIRRDFKCQKINIFCVGPVVGITTGPGMVGLFGFGKEVTFKGD